MNKHLRRRLWPGNGSCIRLRPEKPNHVWSYDFVETRNHDGRSLRLTMIDEYIRQCLMDRVVRRRSGMEGRMKKNAPTEAVG
jgi:hypothetical protein